ncbi:MAG: hypothetical protein IIA59_09405 [Candidatus Marinimicrobia bacterium]|nr:hypothetical protein [Candidatus Neomarinimicrobiota bacterium]
MHQIANDQIEQRLTELRTEYTSGQKMLADTETSLVNMRSSLLRIAGAIQVLEELLGQEDATPDNGAAQMEGAKPEAAVAALDEKPS